MNTNRIPPRLFERVRIVKIAHPDFPHGAVFDELILGLGAAFAALGSTVDISTNALIGNEGVNIILGAHGLAEETFLSANSVIVNLEQFRSGQSARRFAHYIELLRRYPVLDYSARNAQRIQEITGNPHVHRMALGCVPQLSCIEPAPQQDIDVLFYGSTNERRIRILDELEARGLVVHRLMGIYGAERNQWIARSKVILNIHFYDDKIHEVVRTSFLLANRKAIVSECDPETEIDDDLRQAMAAVPYDELVDTCVALVRDDERRHALEQKGFEIFSRRDQVAQLAEVLPKLSLPLPRQINLGSGKSYDPAKLNIDVDPKWQPDILGNIAAPLGLRQIYFSPRFGLARLEAGQFDDIVTMDVLEHIPDLTGFMTHCLNLLSIGGAMRIGVPYDLSYGAWQDPTHVRAFNERSWLYYTDWHWYLGWNQARFDLAQMTMVLSPLGQSLRQQGIEDAEIFRIPRAVDSMQVVLVKRALTEAERQRALAWQQGRRGAADQPS